VEARRAHASDADFKTAEAELRETAQPEGIQNGAKQPSAFRVEEAGLRLELLLLQKAHVTGPAADLVKARLGEITLRLKQISKPSTTSSAPTS
jgi:hypothetical protein